MFTNLTVTFEGGGGGGPNRISSGVADDARTGVLRSARGVAGAPQPTTTHGAAAISREVSALNVGAMAAATARGGHGGSDGECGDEIRTTDVVF